MFLSLGVGPGVNPDPVHQRSVAGGILSATAAAGTLVPLPVIFLPFFLYI